MVPGQVADSSGPAGCLPAPAAALREAGHSPPLQFAQTRPQSRQSSRADFENWTKLPSG